MTPDDRENMMAELDKLWPKKFSDSNLAYWAKELAGESFDDVVRALLEWKNSKKFAPRLEEIKPVLHRYAIEAGRISSDASKTKFKTTIASAFAQTDRRLLDLDEAEVLVRYHRGFWVRYVRQFAEYRATRPNLQDDPAKERKAQNLQAAERSEKERLAEHEASIRKRCVGDLCAAGVDPDRAALLADGVFVGRENWDAWVQSMRSADVPVM